MGGNGKCVFLAILLFVPFLQAEITFKVLKALFAFLKLIFFYRVDTKGRWVRCRELEIQLRARKYVFIKNIKIHYRIC
jgi:hypothetical protein